MTILEYMQNPMGKGSAVVPNKVLYEQLYNQKWDALMVRENGKIDYNLYQSKKDDYYIHIKIPDEAIPKFYYDTVIRFYLPLGKKKTSMESTLNNYEVQFFSNDPSFVYTFAYAFNKNKMLVDDLKSKMSPKALKDKPVVKNPKMEIGYVKSIYFAYIFMRHNSLLSKSRWIGTASPYSASVWSATVMAADYKLKARQELSNKKTREEKQINKPSTAKESPNVDENGETFLGFNQPNFGHFKKTNYNNDIQPVTKINKSPGKFKGNKK